MQTTNTRDNVFIEIGDLPLLPPPPAAIDTIALIGYTIP